MSSSGRVMSAMVNDIDSEKQPISTLHPKRALARHSRPFSFAQRLLVSCTLVLLTGIKIQLSIASATPVRPKHLSRSSENRVDKNFVPVLCHIRGL